MRYTKILLSFLVIFLFIAVGAQAQHTITGNVADSLTTEPLAYVNIRIKNTTRGAQTNEQGEFSIQASLFDTLLFSFVGYKPLAITIRDVYQPLELRMPMIPVLLKTVTAYGNIKIPGIESARIPKKSNWGSGNNIGTPQYGTVQTFGVGYKFNGAFSQFSKSEKEKEKLKEVKAENSKISTYLDVVNSPEVKDELMKKYSLTEEGFYDILAKYNQAHHKSMYNWDSKSLTTSIFSFFSWQMSKK